ncbi:Xyloside xylosyltransferase 1 [Frankliniella fusca]|uniref:Xyloside xylosyltransferase 1 n=1 Tax=Frankliniella fusca TaxID=407009 RepID=A0AAE1GVC8_9NEOP|nr:Xyloside xylosyltransferase 1 [Frankliniella fusca]
MRVLHKVLFNLILLVSFLVVFYVYNISNSLLNRNSDEIMAPASDGSKLSSSSVSTPKEEVNVWCIFTKAAGNASMKYKLLTFSHSLVENANTVIIYLHVIVDTSSQRIAQEILQSVKDTLKKDLKISFYDVNQIAKNLKSLVAAMQPHFSSQPGSYYSDSLFFLSLGLHHIAPVSISRAAMFDIDTKILSDVGKLFELFESFGNETLFALAPELSPVYRHVLYLYRSKNPSSKIGDPIISGGYPGLNSGVILFALDRLRNSPTFPHLVHANNVTSLAKKYSFKGHLGDQDFYTLLGFEHPELVSVIPCNWNRQLCTWWSDHGYRDVMPQYAHCEGKVHVWHGNCNTPIPAT